MKQRLIAAGLALALTAAACERKPPPATGATQVLTVPGFKTPESVKYDPDLDLYLVTNINGNPSAKDNNGFISRIRPDGTVDSLAFVAGGAGRGTLKGPQGTGPGGDTLWVGDNPPPRRCNQPTRPALPTGAPA